MDRLEAIKAFRLKYKDCNISNERLAKYADKWITQVSEDNTIDTVLDLVDIEALTEIARLDDKLRNTTTPEKVDETEKTPETNNDIPDWAKALMDKVDGITKDTATKSREEDFNTRFKEAPEAIKAIASVTNYQTMDETAYNAFVSTLEAQSESLKQKEASSNPVFSRGKNPNAGKPTKEQIDTVLKGIV